MYFYIISLTHKINKYKLHKTSVLYLFCAIISKKARYVNGFTLQKQLRKIFVTIFQAAYCHYFAIDVNFFNYHSHTSHIFYYTKKQPIYRLFFVFVLYVKLTFNNLLFSHNAAFFSISSISRLFPSVDNYICYNSVYYTCNQA